MTVRAVGVAALVLLAMAAPAFAVGPLDGAYQISQTAAGLPPLVSYVVIIQTDADIALALLFPEGFWVYGWTVLIDEHVIQAALLNPDGTAYGSVALTIVNGHVTGTIVEEGVAYVATGDKVR